MSYGGNGMCRKNVNRRKFSGDALFAQCLGDVHQVIIVDPDEIVGLRAAGDGIRVTFVNLLCKPASTPARNCRNFADRETAARSPRWNSRSKIRRAQSHSGPPARHCNRRRGWLRPAARCGILPAVPGQPIHVPPRSRSTGSTAETSPPTAGVTVQRSAPVESSANGNRLETIIRRFILQAILNCHSERSEESLIISGSPLNGDKPGMFRLRST